MLPTGTAKIYWLIRLYLSDHHDVGTFCKEFERTYNFEVDKSGLSASEHDIFARLFNKVTLYSPFDEEIEEYPAYQSAKQIRESVATTQSALGIKI
jgi:hypothetical protein